MHHTLSLFVVCFGFLLAGMNKLSVSPDLTQSVPLALAGETSDTLVIELGVVDGHPNEVFGEITDIEVASDGNIYILDDQSLTLHWFSPSGEHRGSIGGRGGGPGEFRAPKGLEIDSRGSLQVTDIAHGRISSFLPTDTGLVFSMSLRTPLPSMDFCILGDRRFILAMGDDGIIHEIDTEGDIIQSFGAVTGDIPAEFLPFARSVQYLRKANSDGQLLCTVNPELIIVLHDRLPTVRAFNPNGELVWETILPDYHAGEWEAVDGGRGSRRNLNSESGTIHTGAHIARYGVSAVAITLHERHLADPEGQLEVRTLSLQSGEQLTNTANQFAVAGTRGDMLYGFVQQPFPKVFGFRRK